MMTRNLSLPIDLEREEARDLARRELSQPGYETDVSWWARALEWVLEQFDRLLGGAAGAIPGGLGTVLLLAAVAAIVVVTVLRTGPMARRRRGLTGGVFSEPRRSAAEYRTAADDAAAAGDWTTAVVERFRAVVTTLEERGIVEARAGQTADEVARHAGQRLPDSAGPLLAGARLFDQAVYGGRTATADDDATMRELDRAVQRSRPQAATESDVPLAVPR